MQQSFYNQIITGVIERDENQTFPADEIKKLGELGFLGMMVDPKYGELEWILFLMSWQWKKYPR